MLHHYALEECKDRLADVVGDTAWQAVLLPREERAGYVWLTLQSAHEMYASKYGKMEPHEAEELADHLQKWTEATVYMLEISRDKELWRALWGS
jgi:deoxyinosine 3'endonuclease (endonuclease V)